MFRNHLLRLSAVVCLLALGLTWGSSAGRAFANSPRVTEGDAEAVFNAFLTGGQEIRLQRGLVIGGPSDVLHAGILPFAPFDGRHYCADDWHAIMLGLLDGGDSSFTYQDAVSALSPTSMDFTLDGAGLDTTRQPIRRTLNPERLGAAVAYGYFQGRVMSPEELIAGQHTLSVDITDPDGSDTLAITFYVDASGTGACVQ